MSSVGDQVALVTGSSRGIGAAIAKSFAQEGAKVVVHGRDGAALSSIRKGIELAGGRSMQVSGDVTNFAEIEAARLRIEAEFGPLDILVANDDLFCCWAPSEPQVADPLLRREGWDRTHVPRCRGAGRPVRHSGELHCSRDDSHRTKPPANSQ